MLKVEEEVLAAISHPMREDTCFVCGCTLTDETLTREDVIPKWVQRRHALANEYLSLVNNTDIRYSQLTVPCCLKCNGQHLSRMENQVRGAVDRGFEAVTELSPILLYQWMAKIYLGIVYKELFLLDHRRATPRGVIRTRDDLNEVRILWFWLRQSLTSTDNLSAPGSLWIFRCVVPPVDRGESFDLQTFQRPPTLGIRLGSVGIVTDFLDCGILKKEMLPVAADVGRLRLSPDQFVELFVRLSYKASTLGLYTTVRAVQAENGKVMLAFVPQSTVAGENVFREWREDLYADFLASRLGRSVNEVLDENGEARSWIYDSDGNLKQYEL